MPSKFIKMIPIDGERFKHEISYKYGSVRKFAEMKGCSYRTIYGYISNNSIPATLLEEADVSNVTDSESYKKGFTDGYNKALEEIKKHLSLMGL